MTDALNRTAVFRIKAPSVLLDIDIPGLNSDKLKQVLAKQKSSFFCAGEVLQPSLYLTADATQAAAKLTAE